MTEPKKKPGTEKDLSAQTTPLDPEDHPNPSQAKTIRDQVPKTDIGVTIKTVHDDSTPSSQAPTEPYDPNRSEALPADLLNIPGYDVVEELGRGGMGVVYKAKQPTLNRYVALKMILAGGLASKSDMSRFRAEAQAVAQLQHPNIVQIFQIGEHGELPFFSLEYCAGGSLADHLNGMPLPPMKAAELVEVLAQAVQVAHEKNIIHRDLKPMNVLLQPSSGGSRSLSETSHPHEVTFPESEESASLTFVPKITDFGLAKTLANEDDATGEHLTHSGAVMGTPSYMAPEQAGAKGFEIGVTTDVYALGAILYELLTGRPPFRASTPVDTVLQVLDNEPVPPTKLQPGIPKDVQTICLKCLRKDPQKRYASALELAEDLRRFQLEEPIHARPTGIIERSWRWCKRRPAIAISMLVTLLAIVGGLAGVLWFAIQAHHSAEVATNQKIEADTSRKRAERLLYGSKILLAHQAWLDHNIIQAERLLTQSPERFRHWEHDYLSQLCSFNHSTLQGHLGEVWSADFSFDGSRLASSSGDQSIIIWDAQSQGIIQKLSGHTATVWSVDFSPTANLLVSGSGDKTVRLWNLEKGTSQKLEGHTGEVWYVRFDAKGERIASAGQDNTIHIWDVKTGKLLKTLQKTDQHIWSLAFHPTQDRLASAGGDFQTTESAKKPGELIVWDLKTGNPIYKKQEHAQIVTSVSYNHDGSRLATASYDRSVIVWDADEGEVVRRLIGHTHWVGTVKFSPDGKQIATGSCDKTAKLWETKTGRVLKTFQGHTNWVPCVAFHPDGGRLATASRDHTVQLWKLEDSNETITLKGHTESVLDVAFHPKGEQMATASEDQTVKIWRVRDRQLLSTIDTSRYSMNALAYSPDGHYLATGDEGGTLRLYDAHKGREIHKVDLKIPILRLAFNRVSAKLAISLGKIRSEIEGRTAPGKILIWDVKSKQTLATLTGHNSRVADFAFTADGRLLSVSGFWIKRRHKTGELFVWDVKTGKRIKSLELGKGIIHGIALTADDQKCAIVCEDQLVRLIDIKTWKVMHKMQSHTGDVSCVTFTPDGRRVITGSHDQTIKIWDPISGQVLLSLREHHAPIYRLAIDPKGHQIVSVGESQLMKLSTDQVR